MYKCNEYKKKLMQSFYYLKIESKSSQYVYVLKIVVKLIAFIFYDDKMNA